MLKFKIRFLAHFSCDYDECTITLTENIILKFVLQPFADGLVTVIVPHLGRGENSLLLWNNSKQNAPICSFVGHTDVVLDFAWRPKRNNSSPDMELITWSRDQSVRVWKIDEALQKQCESPLPEDDSKSIQFICSTTKYFFFIDRCKGMFTHGVTLISF